MAKLCPRRGVQWLSDRCCPDTALIGPYSYPVPNDNIIYLLQSTWYYCAWSNECQYLSDTPAKTRPSCWSILRPYCPGTWDIIVQYYHVLDTTGGTYLPATWGRLEILMFYRKWKNICVLGPIYIKDKTMTEEAGSLCRNYYCPKPWMQNDTMTQPSRWQNKKHYYLLTKHKRIWLNNGVPVAFLCFLLRYKGCYYELKMMPGNPPTDRLLQLSSRSSSRP